MSDALLNRSSQSAVLPPPPAFVPTQAPVPLGKKGGNKKWWGLGIAAFFILSSTFKDCNEPSGRRSRPAVSNSRNEVSGDAIELAYWNSVKDSKEPRLYNEYLSSIRMASSLPWRGPKVEILTGKESPKKPASTTEEVDLPDDVPAFVGELAMWKSLNESSDPKLYETYLERYPKGFFASLARLKLASLEKKK